MEFTMATPISFFIILLDAFLSVSGQEPHIARVNKQCDVKRDILLVEDVLFGSGAFLRCAQAAGVGKTEFWKREFCPRGLVFVFVHQSCKNSEVQSVGLTLTNVALIDHNCANGEQCLGGSICDRHTMTCLCPLGTEPNLKTFSCQLKREFSSTVKPLPSRVTSSKFPKFTPTHPSSLENVALPGSSCSRGEQCVGGSTCSRNLDVCICPADTEDKAGVCTAMHIENEKPQNKGSSQLAAEKKQRLVADACQLNSQCMIGAYCNGNTAPPICQCLSTHVNIDRFCHKVIYPGQEGCEHDAQCTAAYDGSSCLDRKCVCPRGAFAMEQTCVTDDNELEVAAAPGQSCSDPRRTCSGGSVCRDGWCVCSEAGSRLSTTGICISPKQTTTTPISYVTNSLFRNSPPNPFYGRETAPGTNCGPLDRCLGGSECIDGLCICAHGTVVLGQRCVNVSGDRQDRYRMGRPMDPCSEKGRLCLANAVCDGKMCQCPEGTLFQEDSCVSNTRSNQRNFDMNNLNNLNEEMAGTNQSKKTLEKKENIYWNAMCPSGSEPLLNNETKTFTVCNGARAASDCPPNSYCYITGHAHFDYFCCRSG